MPKIKNIDSFNFTILDNLTEIANNRMQSRLNTYLWFKKELWKDIFPEAYEINTFTESNQPVQTMTSKNGFVWTPSQWFTFNEEDSSEIDSIFQ